jgi:hypothetical protein
MRSPLLLWSVGLSLSLGLGACKWTDFDDLAGETWVDSTEKPDVNSSDYGIAIQRSARTGNGGRLVVLGAGTATYSELAYSPEGEATFPPTEVSLQAKANVPNIGTQPIIIADPSNDNTSLIVQSDNGVVILFGAQGTLTPYQLFSVNAPDAATYMVAPSQAAPQPLVGVGDTVYGAVLPNLPAGTTQPSCKLVDGGSPTTKLQIRALGGVRNSGTTDDVLMWEASGKLYRYPGSVFNGCMTQQAHTAVVDTGFMPEAGSILSVDGTTVVLQGRRGENGVLRAFSSPAANMLAPLGEAAMVSKLRTAALLDVASGRYVIAGVPTALVDGKTAGQVLVFKIGATGLGTLPVATLNDAQPDNNQSFGRAVVAMPFNGSQVMAVAADNEVFVYFRANLQDGTALYGETRQGR